MLHWLLWLWYIILFGNPKTKLIIDTEKQHSASSIRDRVKLLCWFEEFNQSNNVCVRACGWVCTCMCMSELMHAQTICSCLVLMRSSDNFMQILCSVQMRYCVVLTFRYCIAPHTAVWKIYYRSTIAWGRSVCKHIWDGTRRAMPFGKPYFVFNTITIY